MDTETPRDTESDDTRVTEDGIIRSTEGVRNHGII